MKFAYFSHFWLLKCYTLYITRIETCILRSFWGVNQVSMTSNSRDMMYIQLNSSNSNLHGDSKFVRIAWVSDYRSLTFTSKVGRDRRICSIYMIIRIIGVRITWVQLYVHMFFPWWRHLQWRQKATSGDFQTWHQTFSESLYPTLTREIKIADCPQNAHGIT